MTNKFKKGNADIKPVRAEVAAKIIRYYDRKGKAEAQATLDAIAEIGLTSFIHSKTGYLPKNKTAAPRAHSKVDRIVSEVKHPWSLRFDKDWQVQACRLCGVTWKHPRMGQFINQTVYDFFPKEAIAKIRKLNANGQQEHVAHHQYLTPEFDAVAYRQHLRDIYGYMLASRDLTVFWRLMEFRFNRTFQTELFEQYLPD